MPKDAENYTDKRTGIVYTNVNIERPTNVQRAVQAHQQYIDAFIPDSFLKTYFG
jgi:hypothetical protein